MRASVTDVLLNADIMGLRNAVVISEWKIGNGILKPPKKRFHCGGRARRIVNGYHSVDLPDETR
jgi:hypothetical protein